MEKDKKAVRIHTKITEDMFNMIISSNKKGYTPIQIAQKLGLSTSAIEKAIRHKTWAGHLEYLEALKRRDKKKRPKENQISMSDIIEEQNQRIITDSKERIALEGYGTGHYWGFIAAIRTMAKISLINKEMASLLEYMHGGGIIEETIKEAYFPLKDDQIREIIERALHC